MHTAKLVVMANFAVISARLATPRIAYAKNRSVGPLLLNLLPRRAQCFVIRLLLGAGNPEKKA